MSSHNLDHGLHDTDAGNSLHSDILNVQELHHQDHLFNNQDLAVNQPDHFNNHGLQQDNFAFHQPDHLHNGLQQDNFALNHPNHDQFIGDSQPDFNDMRQSIASGQSFQHLDHNQFLADSHSYHEVQRSGSANFTPSSTADISQNKEVTFKDSSGNEHNGTVTGVGSSGDTYKIQTSDGTHENVAYHDIQKYGSK